MSLGLKRGTVQLEPHDKQWDETAIQTIKTLKSILGDDAIDTKCRFEYPGHTLAGLAAERHRKRDTVRVGRFDFFQHLVEVFDRFDFGHIDAVLFEVGFGGIGPAHRAGVPCIAAAVERVDFAVRGFGVVGEVRMFVHELFEVRHQVDVVHHVQQVAVVAVFVDFGFAHIQIHEQIRQLVGRQHHGVFRVEDFRVRVSGTVHFDAHDLLDVLHRVGFVPVEGVSGDAGHFDGDGFFADRETGFVVVLVSRRAFAVGIGGRSGRFGASGQPDDQYHCQQQGQEFVDVRFHEKDSS